MKNLDAARILIVDDQVQALHGMSRIMRGAGYETLEASNGADCLKLAADQKPDLILLDVVLPDIDGLEVCRRIKSDPGTADISVVLLSSIHVESDIQAEGLERGADGYIARPIPNRELLARVKSILRLKYAESRLSDSENRYQAIFNNAAVGIDLVNAEGRFLQVNSALQDMLGYTEEELKTFSIIDVTFPDDRHISNEKFAELKKGAINSYRLEKRYIRKDGSLLWADISISAIKDSGGRHAATIGVISDITERKLAEEALRLSESQKTAILDGITTNIFFVNDKLEILWANKNAAESVGRSPEEMIGATCHALWADPKRPCENCPTLKAFQTKKSEEAVMTTPDGRICDERGEPVFDDRGNLMGVVGITHDITEYQRLTAQEKQLITAIEQAAEAVIITDHEGTIQYVNHAQEILSRYSVEELVGQTPNVLNSDFHDVDFYKQLWDTIGVGKVWSGHFVNRKKEGTRYHEDATISPIYDKSGNLTNFVVVQHDITKQFELQEQLFQAQKMEAIGTLTGGFAHDFNNKLQVIAGYVELTLFDKDLPETLKANMGTIKQTVDSCVELIKEMLVFSRKTSVKFELLNLNNLVTQLRSMLVPVMPKMIDIDLVLAGNLWPINAAPNQIDQILMNLSVNARDAMPDGGKLIIQTENTILDEEFCRSSPNTKPGRYVLLSVTDTGSGMDEQTVRRIFEPFFTTKAKDKGTGLGLAVVYGIVERHRGRIICDSSPSVGTAFKIYFPAIEDVAEEIYF
jgi:two-component system, cell cycle sensor histidine kinase and response regulator CckA